MYNGDALTTYQATVQDFIDGGGNFVCWLCGHKHADYIVYHPTYPKQVFIGVGGALFTARDKETRHRGALTLDYSTSPATVVYND